MPDENSTGTQQQTQGTDQGGTPETWQAWLEAQPEEQRTRITTLYSAHEQGLRSALDSERNQRKAFERDLNALKDKAEKGSALEQQLNGITAQLESANRRADFVEAAVKPEVGIADVAAAWIIANATPDTYFNKRGQVDFALLKQNHPALFKSAAPPRANAGNGSGQDGGATSINDFIRRAAGRT